MTHIVVDPVTRIEGHLRIEAEVEGGRVTNAWSSSTMFRGIEMILQGRDPRDAWAFTQRICGVCTTVHAIASIRSVEDAIGAIPPPNARVLRNLIMAAQCVQDHVIHFYHLHALDWVDIVSALSAEPAETATARAVDLRLAQLQPDLLQVGQGAAQGLRRPRPARPVRQRLLGPPGVQAAAGGQPDGGRALPGGARLAARVHQAPRDPRRQEPPPPELPGRRHGDADRSQLAGRAQHRHDRGAEQADRRRARVRQPGLHPGSARDRVVLQGLGGVRRGRRQLPGLRRIPADRRPQGAAVLPGRRDPQSRSRPRRGARR